MVSMLPTLLLLLGAGPASGQDVAVEETEARAGEAWAHPTCRRLIGITGGLTTTSLDWQFIDDGPVRWMGSPTLGLVCDGAGPGWTVGVETAPFYRSRRLGSDEIASAWIQGHVGWMLPVSGSTAVGPVASASFVRVGGGVRMVTLPFESRHGFDVRLLGLFNGGFEAQLAISFILHGKRVGER